MNGSDRRKTDRGCSRAGWLEFDVVGVVRRRLPAAAIPTRCRSSRFTRSRARSCWPIGKPLCSGWVYFVPKGDLSITPSAKIASDGTFSLVTGGSGEGAPAGDYKVRIEAPGFRPDPKSKKSPFPVQVHRRG